MSQNDTLDLIRKIGERSSSIFHCRLGLPEVYSSVECSEVLSRPSIAARQSVYRPRAALRFLAWTTGGTVQGGTCSSRENH